MTPDEACAHLEEFFGQRDCARSQNDQATFGYWRGYIDCICDIEGIEDDTKAAAEAVYAQRHAFTDELLDAIGEDV